MKEPIGEALGFLTPDSFRDNAHNGDVHPTSVRALLGGHSRLREPRRGAPRMPGGGGGAGVCRRGGPGGLGSGAHTDSCRAPLGPLWLCRLSGGPVRKALLQERLSGGPGSRLTSGAESRLHIKDVYSERLGQKQTLASERHRARLLRRSPPSRKCLTTSRGSFSGAAGGCRHLHPHVCARWEPSSWLGSEVPPSLSWANLEGR